MIFHNKYVLIYMPANDVSKDSPWSRIPLQFGFVFSRWLVIPRMLHVLAAWISRFQNPLSVYMLLSQFHSVAQAGPGLTHTLLAPPSQAGITPRLAVCPFLTDLPVLFMLTFCGSGN